MNDTIRYSYRMYFVIITICLLEQADIFHSTFSMNQADITKNVSEVFEFLRIGMPLLRE